MARISQMLKRGKTFSFEFFPPKNETEEITLRTAIRELAPLKPSFVSVTYRGGKESRVRTTDLVLEIMGTTHLTPMPHLTSRSHSKAELSEIISLFVNKGLENLLALSGDLSISQPEVASAYELVVLARELGSTSIGVAAHPDGHKYAKSLQQDRDWLESKLEIADFAITQFFFEKEKWISLNEDMLRRGINKPILPGIMPVTSLKTSIRMAELSGKKVPQYILDRLDSAHGDSVEERKIGIEICTKLCNELLDADAPGLHFYTLNSPKATYQIHKSLL